MPKRIHLKFDENDARHTRAIEEMFDAPPGTYQLARQLQGERERIATHGTPAERARHARRHHGKPHALIDGFLRNGWNVHAPNFETQLKRHGLEPQRGSTNEPLLAARILDAQKAPARHAQIVRRYRLGITWQ